MAAVEVPQTLEYRGGKLNAAPVLEMENFTNWKKRCCLKENQGLRSKLRNQIVKMRVTTGRGSLERLPSSLKRNPRDQVKSISTTIETDYIRYRRIGI
ncbi:hypothetical protein Tco_0323833 [Tanacetum coccineum]